MYITLKMIMWIWTNVIDILNTRPPIFLISWRKHKVSWNQYLYQRKGALDDIKVSISIEMGFKWYDIYKYIKVSKFTKLEFLWYNILSTSKKKEKEKKKRPSSYRKIKIICLHRSVNWNWKSVLKGGSTLE